LTGRIEDFKFMQCAGEPYTRF